MAYEDGVFATFYNDGIKNDFKTKKEGFPVFDTVLMLKVQVPNSTDCVPRPARDEDKKRFPKSWQAYVEGSEPAEHGYPLNQWPQITAGELKILEANQIKTVEQLAELADSGIHRLGQGGQNMKTRAQKFLASRGETETLRQENDKLRSEVSELEERLKRVEAQMSKPVEIPAEPEVEDEQPARKRFHG